MNLNNIQKEEYESQLYGKCIRCISSQMRHSIHENIKSAANDLQETVLRKSTNLGEDEKEEVKSQIKDLINLSINASKEPLKLFVEEINNFLKIPDNVLLPEDKLQEKQYTEDELIEIQKEIESLKKRALRAKVMNKICKEELSLYDSVQDTIPVLEQLINIPLNENEPKIFPVDLSLPIKDKEKQYFKNFINDDDKMYI